jgi:hypothetical protein
MAEADGNRTRLSRVAAHTGFEDRGAHQDPDTSAGSLPARAGSVTWGNMLGRSLVDACIAVRLYLIVRTASTISLPR